nr:hyaluronidase A-like [Onthophagus taurus]
MWREVLLFYFFVKTASGVLIEKSDYFQIYWNIPSFQCRPFKIPFTDLTKKYGIIQNENDDFRGDKISILYDPGNFPAILENSETDKIFLRNGGVPQQGNLSLHLEIFKESLQELIINNNFSGIAIIDFESWRPIFRQNFGTLTPYKEISYKIEETLHPTWTQPKIKLEAQKRFELTGRDFVEETLLIAKEMRPKAYWGYYAYPYCFNMSPGNNNTKCSQEVMDENDRLNWLFSSSTAYFPSIYLSEKQQSLSDNLKLIEGRIQEAIRILNNQNKMLIKPKILPYVWLKYRDTQRYMPLDDLNSVIKLLKALKVDGFIIWGSSNDVSSRIKCNLLYHYVNDVLGPIISPN